MWLVYFVIFVCDQIKIIIFVNNNTIVSNIYESADPRMTLS